MASNRTKTGRLLNDTAQLLALPELIAAHMAAGDTDAAWQMVMQMHALTRQMCPAINAELAKITEQERATRQNKKQKVMGSEARAICSKVKDLLTIYTHLQLAEQIGVLAGKPPTMGAVIKWSLAKHAPNIRHSKAIILLHNKWQRPA